MRIGMVLMGGVYPPDIRVEKEAGVLARAGHDVFLLASDKDGRPHAEKTGAIEVLRYGAKAGPVESKLAALSYLLTWRSPLMERRIDAFVSECSAEVLHVHDLPAVSAAVAVGRRRGIPVVFDMHEDYPAAVTFWDRSLAARIFHTPTRFARYERRAVSSVDRVVAVVDESRDRVVALGADRARVVVFSNVDDAVDRPVWAPSATGFTIAYAGGFGPHRGLDVLVDAMALVTNRRPDARLVLMGSGSGEEELRARVDRLGLNGSVEFTGWLDEPAMWVRLEHAHVGVVPHARNAHTDSTVPHKLFQYFALGLPVVVTDCAPLERIARETGGARVARAGDARSLAQEILACGDEGEARSLSESARTAARGRYSIEREGESLRCLYDGL